MISNPILKELARLAAAVAVAAPLGAYIGYTQAISAPIPAQYGIIDLREQVKTLTGRDVDPNKMSGQIAMQDVASKIRDKLQEYTNEGVVILDSSAIVAAPPGAYIKINVEPGEAK